MQALAVVSAFPCALYFEPFFIRVPVLAIRRFIRFFITLVVVLFIVFFIVLLVAFGFRLLRQCRP
jgi:hypothetical protein